VSALEKTLWFVAIVPPENVVREIREIQIEIAERFGPNRAMRLPPHITLEPPFRLALDETSHLKNILHEFFSEKYNFAIELRGFGAFRHDVVFIEVVPNLALLEMQASLSRFLRDKERLIHEPQFHEGFTPHLTIANRDVKEFQFRALWHEFNTRKFYAQWDVKTITLLRHNNKNWEQHAEFALRNSLENE